jgi:hypothetical protein
MMNTQSLSRHLMVALVGTAVGVLGCSHANSNSTNNMMADARPRRSTPMAYQYDYSGRPLARTGAQPVMTQQPGMQPAGTQPPAMTAVTQPPASQPVAEQQPNTPIEIVQRTEPMPAADEAAPAPETTTQPVIIPADNRQAVTQLPQTVEQDNTTTIGLPHVIDREGAVQTIDRKVINPEDSFHDRRNPAPRRGFVDLTAQPWFSHAPDYSWLAGQLRFSKSNTSWRLRYASLDENDPYDGEVTLVDYPQIDCLKDGQYVRVSGHLVDPERKELGSHYRVSSMQPIQNTSDPIAAGGYNSVRPAGLPK